MKIACRIILLVGLIDIAACSSNHGNVKDASPFEVGDHILIMEPGDDPTSFKKLAENGGLEIVQLTGSWIKIAPFESPNGRVLSPTFWVNTNGASLFFVPVSQVSRVPLCTCFIKRHATDMESDA